MTAGITELTMNNDPEREYLKERKRSFKDVAILVGETIDEAFWKVTDSPARVTMHDAAPMCVSECPRNFAHNARCVGWRKGAAVAKPVAQRFAFDVTHDKEDELSNLADPMNGNDVRVRKSCSRSCFANKTCTCFWVARERNWQNLDSHVAVELNADPQVNGILVQLPLPGHLAVPGDSRRDRFRSAGRARCR